MSNFKLAVPLFNFPLMYWITYGGHADESASIRVTPAPELQRRTSTNKRHALTNQTTSHTQHHYVPLQMTSYKCANKKLYWAISTHRDALVSEE